MTHSSARRAHMPLAYACTVLYYFQHQQKVQRTLGKSYGSGIKPQRSCVEGEGVLGERLVSSRRH